MIRAGKAGEVFVLDRGNGRVRKTDSSGAVTTLAPDQGPIFGDAFNLAYADGKVWTLHVAPRSSAIRIRCIQSDGTLTRISSFPAEVSHVGGFIVRDGQVLVCLFQSNPTGHGSSSWLVFDSKNGRRVKEFALSQDPIDGFVSFDAIWPDAAPTPRGFLGASEGVSSTTPLYLWAVDADAGTIAKQPDPFLLLPARRLGGGGTSFKPVVNNVPIIPSAVALDGNGDVYVLSSVFAS